MIEMIDIKKISGSGFTIIVNDLAPANDLEVQSQDDINIMFNEIVNSLAKRSFEISIAGENEDIMRLQGRLMFNELYKVVESEYIHRNGD